VRNQTHLSENEADFDEKPKGFKKLISNSWKSVYNYTVEAVA